jgi:LacI family transcriptional regulator
MSREKNRSRSTKKIPAIGLMIESSRASGRALLCGIAKCAHHYGPWAIYWEPGGLEKAWPKLKALDMDGIILRDVDQLAEVSALGIPAVVIGHSKTEIPNMVNVVTDSGAVGRIGAEHLLKCGFKHFAFCGYGSEEASDAPRESSDWSRLRQESFTQSLHKAGYPVHDYTTLSPTSQTSNKEHQRMAAWLQSLPKPLGVMACNDDCGRHVIEACKLAHLAVPDVVGVLGADNDEVVCGLSDPPMSSVAIHFERAGYDAALVLFRLLRGKKHSMKIMVQASHVIARRSTDITAASNPHVTKALQFIRDHARENVMVMEVSRAAGLSRRALEIKFRQEVGCSIREHIRRIRTDQIVRLLVETDLPIGQIAHSLGFADIQHFARYFRAGKHTSPRAFRREHSGRVG